MPRKPGLCVGIPLGFWPLRAQSADPYKEQSKPGALQTLREVWTQLTRVCGVARDIVHYFSEADDFFWALSYNATFRCHSEHWSGLFQAS